MTKATLLNESMLISSWRTFVLKYYQVLQETSQDYVSFATVYLFVKFWQVKVPSVVTRSADFLSGLPRILVMLFVDCSLCLLKFCHRCGM